MTAEPDKSDHAAGRAGTNAAGTNPVIRATTWLTEAVIRVLPAPVRQRLETDAGKRFTRFVPAAIAAVIASQITLALLTGFNMTAGKAALCASVVGAAVSYMMSRWAWERKGRPDLLRETVPFWLVSFTVWGFLSLVTHYAGAYAKHEHLHHLEKHLVVNGTYLAANCVTFVARFLIFHHLLFASRRRTVATPAQTAGPATQDGQDPARMALATDSPAPTKPQG